jgi:hypothetical protein
MAEARGVTEKAPIHLIWAGSGQQQAALDAMATTAITLA